MGDRPRQGDLAGCARWRLIRDLLERESARPMHLKGLPRALGEFGERFSSLRQALTRINYGLCRRRGVGHGGSLVEVSRLDQTLPTVMVGAKTARDLIERGFRVVVETGFPSLSLKETATVLLWRMSEAELDSLTAWLLDLPQDMPNI